MLAKREAELLIHENPKFVNRDFMQSFPQRTLEVVKGRRRRQDHKDMVQTFLEEIRSRSNSSLEEELDEPPGNVFLDFLESLPARREREFKEKELHEIAMEARVKARSQHCKDCRYT